MVRIRLIMYVGAAFLFILIMAAFTSESFSLNALLHPVPRSPPLKESFVEGVYYIPLIAVAHTNDKK